MLIYVSRLSLQALDGDVQVLNVDGEEPFEVARLEAGGAPIMVQINV